MDLDADTTQPGHFFDLPYPSDLRLDAAGHPLVAGWPNPNAIPLVTGLIASAAERVGWPTLAVGYFDFDAPLAARALADPIVAAADAPILLVDLSDSPPPRGRLTPVWAQAAVDDPYLPKTVLAVAARPGFVLSPSRTYAFVVRRSLRDANGDLLGVPPAMSALAHGETPPGARGAMARTLYAPLWPVLSALGVPADDVAAATVFTTADVVADTRRLALQVDAAHKVVVRDLHVDPDVGATHPRYCELHGTVSFPQFQAGKPPFNTEGSLVLDPSGNLIQQGIETALVVISIPKAPMPAGGYPLVQYFHGSGGDPKQIADASPFQPGEDEDHGMTKGLGPAHVLAHDGIAMAASALPVAPSRLPGATDYQYINFNNLAATRDIFRQGVLEQVLFASAIEAIEIPESALSGCAGPSLPVAATAYRFDPGKHYAQGQSMGGMYANLLAAVEPRLKAVVPTGAGGHWGYFILETQFIPGAGALIASAFDVKASSFVHPLLVLFETAAEVSDPLVSTPRIGHDPLPGLEPRSIYEPVGEGDAYFPTVIYDAMALGYDNEQAGEPIWPSMQAALELDGRAGIAAYPVSGNRRSGGGQPFTGAVVQYRGDGIANPHYIFRQLDAVKYQYRCFFSSAARLGTPSVPAPAGVDDPCP